MTTPHHSAALFGPEIWDLPNTRGALISSPLSESSVSRQNWQAARPAFAFSFPLECTAMSDSTDPPPASRYRWWRRQPPKDDGSADRSSPVMGPMHRLKKLIGVVCWIYLVALVISWLVLCLTRDRS